MAKKQTQNLKARQKIDKEIANNWQRIIDKELTSNTNKLQRIDKQDKELTKKCQTTDK